MGDQPGHLVVEGRRVPGAVTGPGNRGHHHAVVGAAHPRGVGLDEHLGRARIQRPPAANALALVVAAAPPGAVAAPAGGVLAEPTGDHDVVAVLTDTLDHRVAVDTQGACPYPLRLHAVALSFADQPSTAGKPSRATACAARPVRSDPRIRAESQKI